MVVARISQCEWVTCGFIANRLRGYAVAKSEKDVSKAEHRVYIEWWGWASLEVGDRQGYRGNIGPSVQRQKKDGTTSGSIDA